MKYRVVTDKDKLVAVIPVDKVAKLRRVYAQLKERGNTIDYSTGEKVPYTDLVNYNGIKLTKLAEVLE